jgi:polyisoprenoid-binding protein YceI
VNSPQSIFSNHKQRDDHLRSRDFLNARRNPVIVFEATDYTPDTTGASSESEANGANGERAETGVLTGDLTLLGNTHPVELDVTINKQARYPFGHRRETLGISARTMILRSLWGMDYGVADALVGDEVTLRFEFEALQQ